MGQDAMSRHYDEDGARYDASMCSAVEQTPASRKKATRQPPSLAAIAEQFLRELGSYRPGEACEETYGIELLRRATVQGDPEAWDQVQYCFREVTRSWLRSHPSRETAYRLDSEENYIALAFERFRRATSMNQRVEFGTLAAALQYLRASLNGAVVDSLRAYERSEEVSLPRPGGGGEAYAEDRPDNVALWDILRGMLSNTREQRLAYLLYHCGLKPREIVSVCPQEWSDVQEIYQLRHSILERLRRNDLP
jgi:hypothetical protein